MNTPNSSYFFTWSALCWGIVCLFSQPASAELWVLGGSQARDGAYAVDGMKKKGAVQWVVRHHMSGYKPGSLLVTPKVLFVATKQEPPVLHALDSRNGRLLWKFRHKSKETPKPYIFTKNTLYLVWDNALLAIEATKGKVLWKRSFKRTLVAPVIAGDRILVGLSGGAVFALHTRTGKRLWSLWTTLDGCPLVYSKRSNLFLYKTDGYVQARSPKNKRRKWRKRWEGCPTLVDDALCCEQKTKMTPAVDECGSVDTYDAHFEGIKVGTGGKVQHSIDAASPYQAMDYSYLTTSTEKGLIFQTFQGTTPFEMETLIGTHGVVYKLEGKEDSPKDITAYSAASIYTVLWKRRELGFCAPGNKRLFCITPDRNTLVSWGTGKSGLLDAGDAQIQAHLKQLAKDCTSGDAAVREMALANIKVYARSRATASLVLGWNSPGMRKLALQVLGHLGPAAAVAMPGLLRLVRARDVALRLSVLALIAKIGPKAHLAVPALERMLSGKQAPLQAAALKALAAIGPRSHVAMGSVLSLLQHPKPELQRLAIVALGQMKRKALSQFFPLKKQLIQAKMTPARTIALLGALGNIGRPFQVVPLFVRKLRHPDLRVRIKAAKELAALGSKAATATIPLLRVLQAQTTLEMPNKRGAVPVAKRALPTPQPTPRPSRPQPTARRDVVPSKAPKAVGASPAPLAKKSAPMPTMRDFRVEVEAALHKIGAPAMPRLLLAMLSPDPKMRLSALRALAAWKEEARPAIPRLLKALRDPHQIIREEAQSTLGLIGLPALEALFRELSAKDKASRLLARRALLVIGPTSPKFFHGKFLRGTRNEQALAASLLGKFGKAALPALIDGLAHPQIYVRRMATETLASMGSEAKGPLIAKALLGAVNREKDKSLKVAMGKLVQVLFKRHKKRRKTMARLRPRPRPKAAPKTLVAKKSSAWLWGGVGGLLLLCVAGGVFWMRRSRAT